MTEDDFPPIVVFVYDFILMIVKFICRALVPKNIAVKYEWFHKNFWS